MLAEKFTTMESWQALKKARNKCTEVQAKFATYHS